MKCVACVVLFAALLALAGSAQQQPDKPSPYNAEFWKTWGDGQAELSSYDLTEPHYGKPRRGVVVTIFVTEMFSNSARVKADPGKHPKSDEFPVMKMNLVKDFQTGVYDYNDMTSAFLALAPVNGRAAGTPAKVSFSSQEWCGNVYHQLLFDSRSIRSARHSYFDGEGDEQSTLPYPADGISADALPFWARGMAAPFVAPGQSRTAPLLTALQTVRDSHKPAAWVQATFSRSEASGKSEVWTVTAGDWTKRYWVSADWPHAILRWESSTGEKAELLGAMRSKYWQRNIPGGESDLEKLKLRARPGRTT